MFIFYLLYDAVLSLLKIISVESGTLRHVASKPRGIVSNQTSRTMNYNNITYYASRIVFEQLNNFPRN